MDISRSLEERSQSRIADGNDDVKSLKSEENDGEEETSKDRVQDPKQAEETSEDTSKAKTKGRPKLAEKKEPNKADNKDQGQKDQVMDTGEEEKLDSDESDNQQHPDEEHDTEEQHLEPGDQSPIPAATEDTQITIESIKESDEEFQSTAETEEEDDMAGLEELKMEGDEEEEFIYNK